MMKKLLAVALALMLALTGTLALAETVDEVEYPPFQGMTVQSEYDVDRTVLESALGQLGMDENLLTVANAVASIVSEVSEKAVIAANGAQYELSLKDNTLVSIVGQVSEAGVTLATSLVPSYVLSVSAEELNQFMQGFMSKTESLQGVDMNALAEAVSGHMSSFVDVCAQSIRPGAPEMGDYELDGISYNVKVPFNVDVAAIVDASKTLVTDLSNDETVKSALEAMQRAGVNVTMPDASEAEAIDPSQIPGVTVDAYLYMDEQGKQGDTTDVVFTVTPADSDEVLTTGDVLMQGKDVRVIAQFPSANANVGCSVKPTENGGSARFDFDYNNVYLGFAAVCDNQEDNTVVDGYIYLMDDENPLVTSHSVISRGGELTLSPDTEGKTVVTLGELTAEDAGEVISGVGMDFLFSGVGALISQATQLMPDEASIITSLLMGGSEEPEA